MASQPIRSIYFTKLVLENIRSFSERQELKLEAADGRPAQWTLIVGDNGVGKTTLLQCLARMRPVFNEPSDENSGPTPNPVEPELAGEENNDVLDALARSGKDTKAKLEAELSFGVPLEGRRARRRGTDFHMAKHHSLERPFHRFRSRRRIYRECGRAPCSGLRSRKAPQD